MNTSEERTILGHPRGLFVLFFTEMWERFSFYSMRAFLVLYMVKAIQASQKMGNEVYGAYLGFVYAAPFLGGMLADRILGQRRAIVIGGFLMAAAQFTLAYHALQLGRGADPDTFRMTAVFFLGLGLLAAGNGFFKPNISSIVGALYKQGDPRRDGAFTIFYMGINIGALCAGVSGQIAESRGWHLGFIIAGVGMLLGQVIFFLGKGSLMGKGLPPRREPVPGGELAQDWPERMREGTTPTITRGNHLSTFLIIVGVLVFIPVAAYMMAHPHYVQQLAVYVAVPILIYLLWEVARADRVEGQRMLVIIVLCCFSALFWAFFELAGSAVNLFADQKVDRTITWFGKAIELKASLLTASINPAYIILLGIPFAKLWVWLNRKSMEPSSPLKFGLGLIQLGAGFFAFYMGGLQAGENGRCSLIWLCLGFFLHTTGELCLSPVGLSTITKLSPARLVSTFMGVWFLASALGNVFGGWVGGHTEDLGFTQVFWYITLAGVGSGFLLIILTPLLKRLMHGVK